MRIPAAVGSLVLSLGCSSPDSSSMSDTSDTGSGTASGGSSASSGSSATGGTSATGGSSASGGSDESDGTGDGSTGGGGPEWDAGNPDGSCIAGVPELGVAVDTSNPTAVVGTGTPESCTFDALAAAVAGGGIITFDCGEEAVTIAIAATLAVPIDIDTVIDGGRLVTLDGQGQVRILAFDSPGWQTNAHRLTLQHIALVGGKATPTEAIPEAPQPCSQGWNDGQGGALYMRDGNLSVIDCIFRGNEAAPLGPDTGGGAIYVNGSMSGVVVADSTFEDNSASNAGAVGGLFAELAIYDSLFANNSAIGNGANGDDPEQCSVMNNGQNQVGSGGNGGAVYSDGIDVDVTLCGDRIVTNAAGEGAFGGGLFFTSNNFAGNLYIIDTTMVENTGGHWTNVATGRITDAGTAVGTNCNSITIENSTVQGLP